MGDQTEAAKPRRWIRRLLRLGVVAGAGIFLVKKVKSRSAPSEGLWREGTPRDGRNSGNRR